jgi:hypothetical protein
MVVELNYSRRRDRPSGRSIWVVAVGLLLLAWGASTFGQLRVAHLNWSGYDPDPDISQSLVNDRRRANAFIPFAAIAVALDLAAVLAVAIRLGTSRDHRTLNALVLLTSLGCTAWHGLLLIGAAFFASII